ncbi:D-alanyl-D-alanine carboxypeptidase family protein [Fonticella tunisiensis]|uniref:serine-type D-Ala-D-Ala carboxypeptidase n=1 Tax=Fonticella tunisiensis TaxID=1096341 RepID=A0A4R7KPZ1_9CLOT|nr:D-alanyl-D-alanine carboxypeptidase family protein [Fonticella tunisiensis]TDT61220.1 D-alanyl-D-alanine carboxypeptidase (penicillin-binding protein 5/6) [Fonticella tunisiensis]
MKKFLALLITISMILTPQIKAKASEEPSIIAEGAILMDLNTGEILYEKNAYKQFEPASITKIITALITLEKTKLDDKVVVGKNPPYEDGSKIYLLEGEELTVEQLLYALLLESANDAALALAEHIAGSKEAFAKMMNEKAKEIGCKNTNFENPNGLPEPNHYTTAYDMALIAKKAMENPIFRKIVATKAYQIPPTNKQPETRYFLNHNKLLTTQKHGYQWADGIKTGYTGSARHTFVGSATKGDQKLVAVVLKDDANFYNDVRKLFNYGFDNFTYNRIVSKSDVVSTINIDGDSNQIPVFPSEDYYITSPKDNEPLISKEVVLNKSFSSIKKGDVIGYLNISVGDSKTKKIPLISGGNYESSLYNLISTGNGYYKERIKLKIIYLSVGSVFGLFIISGFYRAMKTKRKKSGYKHSRLF